MPLLMPVTFSSSTRLFCPEQAVAMQGGDIFLGTQMAIPVGKCYPSPMLGFKGMRPGEGRVVAAPFYS